MCLCVSWSFPECILFSNHIRGLQLSGRANIHLKLSHRVTVRTKKMCLLRMDEASVRQFPHCCYRAGSRPTDAMCRATGTYPTPWPRGLPSPPVLVMVTGTPWTWTPLMLMVCMAWAAAASWAAFRLMMLPAGAIFGRGRSFRRIVAECFLLVPLLGWGTRDAGLLHVVAEVVAAVAWGLSWTRTVWTSPEGVRM